MGDTATDDGELEMMGMSRSGGLDERGRARREMVRRTGVIGWESMLDIHDHMIWIYQEGRTYHNLVDKLRFGVGPTSVAPMLSILFF